MLNFANYGNKYWDLRNKSADSAAERKSIKESHYWDRRFRFGFSHSTGKKYWYLRVHVQSNHTINPWQLRTSYKNEPLFCISRFMINFFYFILFHVSVIKLFVFNNKPSINVILFRDYSCRAYFHCDIIKLKSKWLELPKWYRIDRFVVKLVLWWTAPMIIINVYFLLFSFIIFLI